VVSDTSPTQGSPHTTDQSVASVTKAEDDHPVRFAGRGARLEIRSRSRSVARVTAWITAFLVLVAGGFWALNSWRLLDPCTRVDVAPNAECVAPASGLRTLQFVVAAPGLAAGVVALVYLVHLATTGRTFRRWRGVALTFSGLVLLWLLVFAVGAFSI